MADTDWLSAGATLLGGLLGGSSGSSGGGTTSTSTNSADPRFNNYVYGAGGVLPSAQNWYQNNSTGLNAQSLEGLNRQYAVASDPNTSQGYTNMQSLGSSLMGGKVAGNPFTDGRVSLAGSTGTGNTAQPSMGAVNFSNPASASGASTPFTQPTYQTQNAGQPTLQALLAQLGGSSSGSGVSGTSTSGSGFSGQGENQQGTGDIGALGGWLTANPGAVSTVAGLLGGPLASLGVRGILSLLSGASSSSPNSAGGINNYGNGNDRALNSAIGTAMNSYGGGGGNASGSGGDSSRGSQSSNGGRNGGDSGGF